MLSLKMIFFILLSWRLKGILLLLSCIKSISISHNTNLPYSISIVLYYISALFYSPNSCFFTCVSPLFYFNNFSIQFLTLSDCSTSFCISKIWEYRLSFSFLKVSTSDFHLDIFKGCLSPKFSFRYFLALSNKIICIMFIVEIISSVFLQRGISFVDVFMFQIFSSWSVSFVLSSIFFSLLYGF